MKSIFLRISAFSLAAAVTSAAIAGGSVYDIPFTLLGSDGVTASGVWVADPTNLSAPPIQLVSGTLDGAYPGNMAELAHWQYSSQNQEWSGVTPYLEIYGFQGQLYADSVNGHPLHNIPFSNGSYAALCSLQALDTVANTNGPDFIVANVVPAGTSGSCGGGGTVNWLISGNASPSTAPVTEPADWRVLGAFTSLSKGSVQGWVVSTGSEVDSYDPGFLNAQTVIAGIPSGANVQAAGQYNGVVFVVVATAGNGSEADVLYAVAASGLSSVQNFSYPLTAPCAGITVPGNREADEPNGLEYFTEPTAQGYAVYSLSLVAGSFVPQQIYADSSGMVCGNVVTDGDQPGGHAFVQEVSLADGSQRVISVSGSGPASQSPVVLVSGDSNQVVAASYAIGGNAWISIQTNPPDVPQVTYEYVVKHWDGTVVEDYPSAQAVTSLWRGAKAAGSIDREFIYVFVPNLQPCTGGSLLAVDPNTLATVAASGVPSDTCQLSLPGWDPVPVGSLDEAGPGGSNPVNSAVAFDATQSLIPLTAPQNSGRYVSMFSLRSGFPFF